MHLPPFIVSKKGNHRNRLTISHKRISLKVKNDISEADLEKLKAFSLMIAQRVLIIYRQTMRGTFYKDLNSIEMMTTSRKVGCLYCWDELHPEGYSNDPVRSENLTSRPEKFKPYHPYQYQQQYHGPKLNQSIYDPYSWMNDDYDCD